MSVKKEVKPLHIQDLTLRDADQTLNAGRWRLEDKLKIASVINAAGFPRAEVWGGTQVEIPARFKGEDPWANLDSIRAAMPDTQLSMLLRSQAGNARRILADDTIKLHISLCAKHGIDVMRIFDATNNLDNLRQSVEATREEGIIPQVVMSYAISPNRDNDFYIELAHKYVEMGAQEVGMKDMAGLMSPEDARYLMHYLQELNVPLVYHGHSTSGMTQATLLSLIKGGIDHIDTAAAGMSDWIGHVSTQDILFLMGKSDDPEIRARIPKNIDQEYLNEITETIWSIRPKYQQFELPYSLELQKALVKAKMPGGMATTFADALAPEAKSRGLNLNNTIIDALGFVPQVDEDFNYVPKVTPTSDILCKQAAFNWVAKKNGQEAYQFLVPPAQQYLLGEMGYSNELPKEEFIALAEAKSGRKRYSGRAADRVSPEIGPARALLGENELDALCDEDVVITIMLKDGMEELGIDFIKNRDAGTPEQARNYEPSPKPPSYLTYAKEAFGDKNGVPFKGDKELIGAIGPNLIEAITRVTVKRQMIMEGASFVGIDESIKQDYLNSCDKFLTKNLGAVPELLSKAGYKGEQIRDGVDQFHKYLKRSYEIAGVSKGYEYLVPKEAVLKELLKNKTPQNILGAKKKRLSAHLNGAASEPSAEKEFFPFAGRLTPFQEHICGRKLEENTPSVFNG